MIKKSLLTVLFSLFFVSSMQAANMQFLRYSPVSQFTSEDFEMMNTTAHNALDKNPDGQTSEWKNPETNNSGSVTPLNTETRDGKLCRKLRVVNQAKDQSSTSAFTFCKADNGWKILK